MEENSSEIQQNNAEQGKAEVGSGVAPNVPTMNHSKANVAKDAMLLGTAGRELNSGSGNAADLTLENLDAVGRDDA